MMSKPQEFAAKIRAYKKTVRDIKDIEDKT